MSRSICGVRAVSFGFPTSTDEMSSGQRLSITPAQFMGFETSLMVHHLSDVTIVVKREKTTRFTYSRPCIDNIPPFVKPISPAVTLRG